MPEITIFPDIFLQNLQGRIGPNRKRYSESASWIEEFANGSKFEIQSRFSPHLDPDTPISSILVNSDAATADLENSIRLHEAFSGLSPIAARDPRLWVRLAHVEFWAYMRTRWPLEGRANRQSDSGKAIDFIKERYFLAGNDSRTLLRNGISRLWWIAHLTIEGSKDDPYYYTRLLFSFSDSQDILATLVERNLGRCRAAIQAFLDLAAERPEAMDRKYYRPLIKCLNAQGGARLIDLMSKDAIKENLNFLLDDACRLSPQPSS